MLPKDRVKPPLFTDDGFHYVKKFKGTDSKQNHLNQISDYS